MTTGNFTDWGGNMTELGPLYPFVGSEMLLVLLLVIFWVGWHVVQVRSETRQHEAEARSLRQGDNLHRVLEEEHTIQRM
jgi:hypothetical protein